MFSEFQFLLDLPGGKVTAFLCLLIGTGIFFQLLLLLCLRIIRFVAGKTTTTLDDRLIAAISPYLPIFALLVSIWFSASQIYAGIVLYGFNDFELLVLSLLAVTGLALSSIGDAILVWYGLEIRSGGRKVNEREVFPFVRNVIRIGIIVLFIVFILQRLGFDTTAIITGLGVGGLAVALALQDTLSNFFGGVHILVDKPFKEDDYIKTDGGVEGQVKQIGWRTTKIETFPSKNLLVVPNSKIASSMLENFSYPLPEIGITGIIGVDYKEDVLNVERILNDALRSVAQKSDLISPSSIWVRFDSFGDFSLNFRYGYVVKDWLSRGTASHLINTEIFYAFKKNNINIPFPVRTIYAVNGADKTGVPQKDKKPSKSDAG
ncbi:mechanosensitive ion channel family protein [Candidatus Micrarchaeota archaeon]|nr:mechanosensitive ion channel family protein [Candidatus Micrarchaeota archaeon]